MSTHGSRHFLRKSKMCWGCTRSWPNSIRRTGKTGPNHDRPVQVVDCGNYLHTLVWAIHNRMRCSMVVRGHVQNGVIVLDDGVRLAEGQKVTVLASDPAI